MFVSYLRDLYRPVGGVSELIMDFIRSSIELPAFPVLSFAICSVSYMRLELRRHAILHAKTAVIDDVWATVGKKRHLFPRIREWLAHLSARWL